jgi:hypothetical protein
MKNKPFAYYDPIDGTYENKDSINSIPLYTIEHLTEFANYILINRNMNNLDEINEIVSKFLKS